MPLLGGSYVRWHVPIPYSPFNCFYFTSVKGEHGPLCPLAIPVTVVQPGFVNGGPKRGSEVTERGEGVGGGFTVGRFLENSCMKTTFSCTLNAIIRGWVMWSDTYQSPTPPLINFTPIKGAGAWPLVSPAMPVTVVRPGFVNGEPKRGSEATERGEGVGGAFPPSHSREIFENSCMKVAFSCTLNTIIRGSLCSGVDQFPTLFLFPNEFVSGKHFLFLFPFSVSSSLFPFFLFPSLFFTPFFYSQINRGAHGPLVPPLATPVSIDGGQILILY